MKNKYKVQNGVYYGNVEISAYIGCERNKIVYNVIFVIIFRFSLKAQSVI